MKAFMCVRGQTGLAHVFVLAEKDVLDLEAVGDSIIVYEPVGQADKTVLAVLRVSEHYFVTLGEHPPTKAQHQAG